MGSKTRSKPAHLAAKLKLIRLHLGLSQNQMIVRLGQDGILIRSTISAFERGSREPSYPVLLAYAKCSGVSTDYLIDDELELPF
jgi:transcriptional regulator with XRE-family HTH domain